VILCVAPNPSIDKLFEVERLEPGGIHRPAVFIQVPGGKGLNVARAAATLGAEVQVVALLGGHAGRWISDELDALGIPLAAVWTASETRSCLSVADRETRSLTEFYESGSPVSEAEWGELVGIVRACAAGAAWTIISGSLPPSGPEGGYTKLAELGRVAVDTRVLGEARPALVKVNAAEAAQLTGLGVDTESAALAAAHALRERTGGDGHAAVVTRGRDGAVLAAPDGTSWRGSLDADGPYPVGSGDAFLAGLVVALDRGGAWPEALLLALGAGAANAEQPGAGRLDRVRAEVLAAEAVAVAA
jgi:1-phosphofructokinase family hexose kinase